MANAGGILGLFMGISLLSFAELVYFMTIRPVCNWLMRLRDQRRIKNAVNAKLPIKGRPSYRKNNVFVLRSEVVKTNQSISGNGPNGIPYLN